MTEDFGDNEVGNAHIAQAVENCESDNSVTTDQEWWWSGGKIGICV